MLCPNLIHAQGDGVLKQGPDHSLSAPWCGQRALIAIVGGHILLRWDQLCQRDGIQRRVAI